MYLGVFPQRMDEKGRISIPVAFRSIIEKSFQDLLEGTMPVESKPLYLVHGPGNYLCVYDNVSYHNEINKLTTLDEFDENVRAIRRVFFAGVALELDAHGRIKIPMPYMKYASLEKDIIVNGMGTFFEIRDKGNWDMVFGGNLTDLSSNMGKVQKNNQK